MLEVIDYTGGCGGGVHDVMSCGNVAIIRIVLAVACVCVTMGGENWMLAMEITGSRCLCWCDDCKNEHYG